MTLEETRKLGIEFERRVQTMIPEKEYLEKMDTETIYSFLNQYQDKYVHEIYRGLDNIQSGSRISAHVESVLQSMLTTENLEVQQGQSYSDNTIQDPNNVIVDTARSLTFNLNENFYMYIRSVSKVSETFSFKHSGNSNNSEIYIVPNQLISQNDVWKLLETPHNGLRILRYPAVVLNEYNEVEESGNTVKKPTITVIYDRYTTIKGLRVTYYRQPNHFDLITSTPCELPMDAFDDIVSGAVDLYVSYVAGAEANRKRQQEQAAKRAREDQRDARRSGGNQDEQA